MEIQSQSKKKNSGMITSIIIVCVILAGSGFGYWYYTKYSVKSGSIEVLSTSTVDTGIVQGFFDATGVIKTEDTATVTVSSKVSGSVNKVFVRTGERVNKNQRLITLDTKDITITVQEAQASLAKAQAELERIKQIFPIQLSSAKRGLEVAKGAHSLAIAVKEKAMKDNKDLPAVEINKLDHAILVAQNNVDTTQEQIDTLQKEYTIGLSTANASVEQANAQLSLVKNQASYYAVYSPISATISNIFVKEGEQIVASSPVVTLIDTTKMEVWVYIDESDIGHVKKNTQVTYTVDAVPNTVFIGTITQIYPQPEIRDGVVYYKAIVPIPANEAKQLYTEMTTQVNVLAQEVKDAVRVPNTALKWIDSKRVVYVKEGEGYKKVIPVLGVSGKEYTEVLEGLEVGDIVGTQIRIQ